MSDSLILPLAADREINGDRYTYRGRVIELTYRFAAGARKEIEQHTDWNAWAGQN